MPRPIYAKIYPAAVAHNLSAAKQASAQSRANVWATIKANAYGHGIERIFSGLREADGLAMLDFAEAALVRALGWRKPILMLEGCFAAEDYALAQALDLTVVVHHQAQIEWLLQAQFTQKINVYLKMNSGMNRVGFAPSRYQAAFDALKSAEQVESITLMTHFANADLPDGVAKPLQIFNQTTAKIMADFPQTQRSCSNSAAILQHPDAHFDWVRPGIMTYGGTPIGASSAASFGLMPAMSLHAQLIAIQELQAGDAVGYGSRFVATQPMRIGVVACGYADGYPRHAPDGTPILVDGVVTRLVGRVSMDMLMVDLSPVAHAAVGSAVELWGAQIAIDDVASAAGTIGYELMCALAPRVPVNVAL